MGSSLSCGCDASRHCGGGLITTSEGGSSTTGDQYIDGQSAAQFRFWAELFQLSSDRSQWTILYPSLLSVTVAQISRKRHAVHVTATCESRVILDQLLDTSSQLTRVSSCFAYWRHQGHTFGVNVVCAEDCDRLCELTMDPSQANEYPRTNSADTSAPSTSLAQAGPSSKPNNPKPKQIPAKLSQIFEVQKGQIKHIQTQFTDCMITLSNTSAVVRVNGKDFSLNLLESVMVIGEVQNRLYISEPGGAFALECDCSKTLRAVLISLLTISSLLISSSNNISNAAHYLQKQIAKLQDKINSLMRSLTALQADCELARDLNEELEMAHLRNFALKYRLAAICDVAFPPPSELLSKVSLRTLRHLSSFGGAAVCSLHLYFLWKARFQISKRTWNSRDELALNVLALHSELMQHSNVSVLLPSGAVLNVDEPAENTGLILRKVCAELGLNPEKYRILREGRHRVRLVEYEYRIQKSDRSLGLTICARQIDGMIKTEVRAVRNGTTTVQVGDTVVSVDDRPIKELHSAEQVETLLRSATSLVLRRMNLHNQAQGGNLNSTSNWKARIETQTFPVTTQVDDSRPAIGCSKTKSMDRISEPSSALTLSNSNDWQVESARSSPSRSSHLKSASPNVMSHSACERSSKSAGDSKKAPILNPLHFSRSAEEQLMKTINELVTTEENFVKDVEKLVSDYLKPLKLSILEPSDRLLRVQTSFLSSLLDAAGDVAHSKSAVSQQQLRDSLIRISALFVNKCSKLKIYSEYSAAYLRFQQNTKDKHEIDVELERLNVSGEQSSSAQSLLIKPIQRVLKYPLFIQQMNENCAKDSVEKQQSEQALARMQALAEYVNEMQRLTEQYGPAVEQIAHKNSAVCRMNFSQLLMFAHVNWLNCYENRSRPVSCVAFVFTSLILILCPNISKNKVRVYRILPIAEIEVNESDGSSTQSQYLFVLIHVGSPREPVYHLCCCQAEVKNQFIKSIRKAAASLAKEQRRPLSGSSQSDGGYSSERHPP